MTTINVGGPKTRLGTSRARPIAAGPKNQSIGANDQARQIRPEYLGASSLNADAEEMPKEDSGVGFEGHDPETLFREFAAECVELAQTAASPEKRALYLKMATVLHQMAQRWEKKT